MDREKLAKLLALTTSDYDNEALTAIRAANRLIKEAGKSWEDILEGPARTFRIVVGRSVPEEYYEAMEAWSRRPKR